MKKIVSLLLLVCMITSILLTATSCKDNAVMALVRDLLNNHSYSYTFDFSSKLSIDHDYLIKNNILSEEIKTFGIAPDSIDVSLTGTLQKNNDFYLNIMFENDSSLSANIYRVGDKLYVELTNATFIALDFLKMYGFVDYNVIYLLEKELDNADKAIKWLEFDNIGDADLEEFMDYLDYAELFLDFGGKIESSTKLTEYTFNVPKAESVINYTDVKEKVQKKLMSIIGYRYEILDIVLSDDEANAYIDMVGIKATGEVVVFDALPIKSDVKNAKSNEDILNKRLLPFRYIFETLGYEVGYDTDEKKAFFIKDNGEKTYVEGKIVSGRTYVSLVTLISVGFQLNITANDGQYIEFTLYRQQ